MKKILLLAGILIVSTISFAKDVEIGLTGSPEAKVPVQAEVLAPLQLEPTPIDFGGVMQGQQNKVQKTQGNVSVKGTSGKNIRVFAKDFNKAGEFIECRNSTTNYSVELKTGNGGENEKMTATLNLEVGESFGLNEGGKKDIPVTGKISASEAQVTGIYKGALAVKVMYE